MRAPLRSVHYFGHPIANSTPKLRLTVNGRIVGKPCCASALLSGKGRFARRLDAEPANFRVARNPATIGISARTALRRLADFHASEMLAGPRHSGAEGTFQQ